RDVPRRCPARTTPGWRCGRPQDRHQDTTMPPDVRHRCCSSCRALCMGRRSGVFRSEGGPIDVCAWNIPARREAGLVEDERARGIGYDAVTMADHEVTGGLANVDAVVVVSGMAHDPFVFFVESVHGLPGKREACLQFA